MNNKMSFFKKVPIWCLTIFSLSMLGSCESAFEFELPEANSKEDTKPPVADFSYNTSVDTFTRLDFTDLSFEATKFSWNFGDGETSTERDPSHTFPEKGTYQVTLTASDELNQINSITKEIVLEEPEKFLPPILESGFEDNSLPDGSGDGRDSWRNSALGGVIQITSGPTFSGDQAAKLTGDVGDLRIGYQKITVTKNADYTLRFNYTMKEEPGVITVSILDGREIGDISEVADAVIATIDVTDNTDPEVYVEATLDFNAGQHEEVAIYFYNDGISESRLDDFSIE